MAKLAILLSLVCLFVGTNYSKLCPRKGLESVDWSKFSNLNGTWYDIIDNPQYEYLIDCWDWKSFISIDDGFAMNATLYVPDRPVKEYLEVYLHFLSNGDGTYSVNQTHKAAYARIVKESISHKATKQMLRQADVVADIIFSAEYFFITNYDTYFMVVQCDTENGLTVFFKNRRAHPTSQDILNGWNLFIQHKETPREEMVFKNTCVNRQ